MDDNKRDDREEHFTHNEMLAILMVHMGMQPLATKMTTPRPTLECRIVTWATVIIIIAMFVVAAVILYST